MTYEGEVQVGGTIAAVGQRLIDTTAKMLIKRFFDNCQSRSGGRTWLGVDRGINW